MPKERPIKRGQQGPAVAIDVELATGGEDLSVFIAEADALRLALGFARWADLAPLCDGTDPKDLDRRGLVKLIGDLGQLQKQGQRPLA